MALNIKNSEVERLAEELSRLEHISKTEVIRRALLEKKQHTMAVGAGASREARLREFLAVRVWPTIPDAAKRPWSREEEEGALGYGEFGEPA